MTHCSGGQCSWIAELQHEAVGFLHALGSLLTPLFYFLSVSLRSLRLTRTLIL